jgi:hypothetical protein
MMNGIECFNENPISRVLDPSCFQGDIQDTSRLRRSITVAAHIAMLTCVLTAQDSREALGPKDRPGVKAPHPLTAMMQQKRPMLRPELRGQHPRVFFTSAELATLRDRSHGSHADIWKRAVAGVAQYMNADPAPPPAQARRAQNDVGLGIAALAFAFRIDGKPEYLARARKYMEAAASYDIWGYANNKPNVDLAAGHLLYGLGWGYDLLNADLTPAERDRYREALRRHGNLLAEYFKPKPGRTIAYSQNHTFIPIAGLAIAAYALYDEIPEAPEWAAEARAIFDRTLATYSKDGYYYEGFEYWVFATPWIMHYLDAHLHATGEDLFDQPGLHHAHEYVAHTVLPDGVNIFDFGDAFEGPLTRSRKSADAERTQPGGHLNSNYNLLYRLAGRFKDSQAQGVANWLDGLGQVNAEDFWSLAWYDPSVTPAPITKQQPWHYFADHDVLYWRSSWTPSATAIAIKGGPPEGHAATALARQFPDWHQEAGHAHPDAGSFIVYANGHYVTGDSGYAGLPRTDQHNTLLIDGKGQEMPGTTHDAFAGAPLERLNKIRLTALRVGLGSFALTADFGAAYPPELGVQSAHRDFSFDGRVLTINDEVHTARPAAITSLIHSDERIESMGLRVETPGVRQVIEPNIITSAGPPGAVDKGPREERGWRVAITVKEPSLINKLSFSLDVKRNP